MHRMTVVVVGQIGRDLVVRTEGLPKSGGSTRIRQWCEALGGKSANQAVGLTQLGAKVALIGVVGNDDPGAELLCQAEDDGIDISGVVRRGETALLLDVVDEPASRRLFEGIPRASLLTQADVRRSAALVDAADTVSIQLQQSDEVAVAVAHRARARDQLVVADGAVGSDVRGELFPMLDVCVQMGRKRPCSPVVQRSQRSQKPVSWLEILPRTGPTLWLWRSLTSEICWCGRATAACTRTHRCGWWTAPAPEMLLLRV